MIYLPDCQKGLFIYFAIKELVTFRKIIGFGVFFVTKSEIRNGMFKPLSRLVGYLINKIITDILGTYK